MILGSPDWVWYIGVPLAILLGVLMFWFLIKPKMYSKFGVGQPPRR